VVKLSARRTCNFPRPIRLGSSRASPPFSFPLFLMLDVLDQTDWFLMRRLPCPFSLAAFPFDRDSPWSDDTARINFPAELLSMCLPISGCPPSGKGPLHAFNFLLVPEASRRIPPYSPSLFGEVSPCPYELFFRFFLFSLRSQNTPIYEPPPLRLCFFLLVDRIRSASSLFLLS